MGRTKRSNPMDLHAQRANGFQGRCKVLISLFWWHLFELG
ncbi:hypothetical protein SLEP1_g14932 [Rubroshorea leprosula]|uniref:Uncharacterized protein n=1 Tax=Rubroshorea leprosula TaxID=152421 RepID=A0AAV5IWH1_9ROSI|nr:hypothetical protein SLEP1_g14932 [Rubroshorea leprosula]